MNTVAAATPVCSCCCCCRLGSTSFRKTCACAPLPVGAPSYSGRSFVHARPASSATAVLVMTLYSSGGSSVGSPIKQPRGGVHRSNWNTCLAIWWSAHGWHNKTTQPSIKQSQDSHPWLDAAQFPGRLYFCLKAVRTCPITKTNSTSTGTAQSTLK